MSTSTSATGNYAEVNGLRMYFEVHGTGRPLVLLHGAFSTIETDFAKLLPAFAETRQVIAVEQQAHGRTADIDRPLSYPQMAEDTAALLRQLGIDQADFFGYSMGGAIAFELAIRHPALVRKLVFAGGTSYSVEGYHPGMLEGLEQIQPEMLHGTPWHESYLKLAPNPDDFPKLAAKIKENDLSFKGWSPDEVRGIKAPCLLVLGDADIIQPEHTVEMFRLLGGGVIGDLVGLTPSRLAILPGTTHVTVIHRTDWLLSMTTEFLDASMPEAS
jgi:pimeloyl-ACP methyl ester carboxylesterase